MRRSLNLTTACVLSTLFLSTIAQAQSSRESSLSPQTLHAETNQKNDLIYGLFGVADISQLHTSPTGNTYSKLEVNQNGLAPALKIIGTGASKRFAFDLGLGIQSAQYSGERIGKIEIMNDENGREYEVPQPIQERYSSRQTALTLESSARLKIRQKFQLGIRASALITRDNSDYSSLAISENKNKNPLIIMAGPQFIYEVPSTDYISRIGASFSVSLTGNNRAIYLTTLSAGWGNHFSDAQINSSQIVSDSVQKNQSEIPSSISPQTRHIFTFHLEKVQFKIDSTELTEESAQSIAQLSAFLLSEKDIWQKIIIEGRIPELPEENEKSYISNLRINSLAEEFRKSGINAESMILVDVTSSQNIINSSLPTVAADQKLVPIIRLESSKNKEKINESVIKLRAIIFNQFEKEKAEEKPHKTEVEKKEFEQKSKQKNNKKSPKRKK